VETHLLRMNNICISKLLYECALTAKRNVGQTSKGWKDQHPKGCNKLAVAYTQFLMVVICEHTQVCYKHIHSAWTALLLS